MLQRENSRDLQRGPLQHPLNPDQCISVKKGWGKNHPEGRQVTVAGTHRGPEQCLLLSANRYIDAVI